MIFNDINCPLICYEKILSNTRFVIYINKLSSMFYKEAVLLLKSIKFPYRVDEILEMQFITEMVIFIEKESHDNQSC